MKLNRLRFQFFVLVIILCGPMGVFGQSSTFQIGLEDRYIHDIAALGDTSLLLLNSKKDSTSVIGNINIKLDILNKFGQITQSRILELENNYKVSGNLNRVFQNNDGTIYIALETRKPGIPDNRILLYLDKDLNLLSSHNGIDPNRFISSPTFFMENKGNLNNRIIWTSTILSPNPSFTMFGKHDLTGNSLVFENYTLSNKKNDIALIDATSINNHSFLIQTESQNYFSVLYSTLTKFNHQTKANTIYRLNYNPHEIIHDQNGHIIILGSSDDSKIVISKYSESLNLIWSKKLNLPSTFKNIENNWYTWSYTQFFKKSITADSDGNIYVNIKESIPELNQGTKILRLDENGNITYHKLLLDATHFGVYDLKIFDNHLLLGLGIVVSFYMRKLPLSGEADDCVSIPVCTEIEDFDAQLFKTDYNLVKIGETVPTNDIDITILPDETEIFHYCEPFLPPDPVFDIFLHQFCVGDTLVIDTSLVYKYGLSEWTLTNENNPKIQVKKYPEPFILDKSGQFNIQHRLIFGGCEYVETMQIKVVEPINDLLPKKITFCENTTKTISLPEALANEIVWSDGTIGNTLDIAEAGNYSVHYKDNNGCIKIENLVANQMNLPTIQLGDDFELCKDSLVVINIPKENDATITWSDGSNNYQKVIANEGQYTVTITNECGEASDDIYVEYKDCSSTFQYSNIFSPNGDGNNDQFVLIGNNISEISIRFYDRWGNLVFKNDYQDGSNIAWDGKCLQNPVISDIYTFVMQYKENISGKTKIAHGNTTIIY